MTAELPELDELKRYHRSRKAPFDAQALAVDRFSTSRTQASSWFAWGAWGVAAAVVCAVLLIPGVVNDDEPRSEPGYGAAGLSLSQMELPARSNLQTISGLSPTDISASELSTSTNLPLGVPNLSQLSVSRIEEKETI